MLRWEGAHEGLSGGGPAKDSAAAEFSARLSQKPALKSSRAVFQPGSKAVTFADSHLLAAELIAKPERLGTASCQQEG